MKIDPDVMTVSLAVARGLVSREDARTAVRTRSPGRTASSLLKLSPGLVTASRELEKLPRPERERCLEIFKDLASATEDESPTEPAMAPGEFAAEDDDLVRLALEKKLVTSDNVRAALDEMKKNPRRTLDEIFKSARLLNAGQLESLRKEARSAALPTMMEVQKVSFACSACGARFKISNPKPNQAHRCPKCSGRLEPQAAETPAGAPSPGTNFGKYRIQGELGRGGMGVVYKAWDSEAARSVAIKCMLRSDDAMEVQRFEREAKTALALSHPNIVKVYDVGVIEGTPYMAMECVSGRSLSDLLNPHRPKAEKPTLERTLGLIRDAALALGHAHQKQIVHRDVKPQNIMVDDAGHVRVMDFGLARELRRGLTLTATGDVIGTPQYMSPEQATGQREQMGPWTDVWALGVMLYEAAAKSAPFEGDTAAEVLHRITHSDAEPLRKRNPRVPRDLETVVMRCLESDPKDRYRTATKLAEDLSRHLEGTPVTARPAGFYAKAKKKILRRKGVALTAAGGFVAVAIVAGLLLPALGREKQRAEDVGKVATQAKRAVLEQLSGTTGAALSAALGFRQQGRLDEMQKFLKQTEEACRKAMAELPEAAEPHYRLGRMYRAMMKDDEALKEQERALEKDPAEGRALYERVVLLARLYNERLRELEKKALAEAGDQLARTGRGEIRGGSKWEKPSRATLTAQDEKARALYGRLQADLAKLQSRPAGVSPAEAECAVGLRAWARGETEEARRRLTAAIEKSPTLEEATETLGKLEADAERLEEAILGWSKGIEKDLGYLPHWVNRAETKVQLALKLQAVGKPFEEFMESAVKDLDQVLQKDPGRLSALLARSHAQGDWGLAKGAQGGDPGPLVQAALKDDEAILKIDPRNYATWLGRGITKQGWALLRRFRGEDTDDLLGEAVADFDRAIEIKPEGDYPWFSRANALSMRGKEFARRGKDPTALYESALRDFGEALRRNPGRADSWLLRGMTRGDWALWHEERGQSSDALYAEAVRDLDECLKLDPGRSFAWLERGKAKSDWALKKTERGQDGEALYIDALKDMDQAIQVNPKNDEAWDSRGGLRANRAIGRAQKGDNVDRELDLAIADLDEAIRLNPTRAGYWLTRGFARGNQSVMKQTLGQDPAPLLRASLEDIDQAIKIRPGNADQHSYRGFFGFHLAHFLKEPDRAAGFKAAIKDLEEAIRINPSLEAKLRPLVERARKDMMTP